MILKGSQRSGAGQLARHLLKSENEHVELHELRGFMAEELPDALQEAYAISQGTRCKQFLFSLSLNPPENEKVPVEVFEKAISEIEHKLGLEDQPRAIVFHEKEGRRHAHVVWSRIDGEEMKAINLPHYKLKLRDISRELYLEHNWQMPRGLMNSEERDPLNYTQAEWQQARRDGNNPKALKAMFKECWSVSDSRKAFAQALNARGFHLARGDRRGFVAVDFKGEIYAIAKWTGVRTKEVKARLGDPKSLLSVSETRAMIASRMNDQIKIYIKETETAFQKHNAQLAFRKADMVQRHREERTRMKEGQGKRWAQETKERSARMSRGFRGIWDRLTGKYAGIRKQNELEAYKSLKRDQAQQQDLIEAQLGERSILQKEIRHSQQAHSKALMRLHKDVAHYMRMNVPTLETDKDAEKIERQRQERERRRKQTQKRGPGLNL